MKNISPKIILILISYFCLLFFLFGMGITQIKPSANYYYNDGRRIYFRISQEQINIRFKTDIAIQNAQSILSSQGKMILRDRFSNKIQPGKNQIFRFNEPMDRNEIFKIMEELNQLPEIKYATPVIKNIGNSSPIGLTNRVNVQFHPDLTIAEIEILVEQAGGRIAERIYFLDNGFSIEVSVKSGKNSIDIANRLFESGKSKFSEPEFLVERVARFTPNDPLYPNQWHLNNTGQNGAKIGADVRAAQAWNISRGTNSVIVAVIDTGIEYTHEDLFAPGKIIAPRDVIDNDSIPLPGPGENHGTACAGIAVAIGNNNIGVSGIAPNSGLMPIRLLATGMTSTHEALAISYAADSGAAVQSHSWGAPDGNPLVSGDEYFYPLPDITRAAIDYAIKTGRNGKGSVIFWAAGNGNEPVKLDGYASYYKVLAIAASNDQDVKSYYSDYGPEISVAAPSNGFSTRDGAATSGIWTVDRTGSAGYSVGNYSNNFGGTSAATPLAAGIGALILSVNPNLDWRGVKATLEQTADKINIGQGTYNSYGHSTIFGYGRVNAYRALLSASESDSIPPAQIIDLKVTQTPLLTLEFTAPGDDGMIGTALYYDIRYSRTSITNANFALADRFHYFKPPHTAYKKENIVINGLSEKTTYYFAVKALDNVGNIAYLSNIVSAVSPSAVKIFFDDVESGNSGWLSQSPWARTTSTNNSPIYSWTDSPLGNYDDFVNTSLTSPTFSLAGFIGSKLEFYHRYDIEHSWDFGHLEISTTGGESWISSNIAVTGTQTVFNKEIVDLSPFDGLSNLKIRFRLESDFSITADGWYIDDIKISGIPILPILTDELPDLKLFVGQSLNNAFNLHNFDILNVSTTYNIINNFLGLTNLSGSTVNQESFSIPTIGTNIFRASNFFGYSESENRVKYSTYKIKRLPQIGLNPGDSISINVSDYSIDSSGAALPPSFGNPNALINSDPGNIKAIWNDDSSIIITALSGFTSNSVYLDVIASIVSDPPFGIDIDRERIIIHPLLSPLSFNFNNASDTSQFAYEQHNGNPLADISYQYSINDNIGNPSNSGVLEISLNNINSNVKITPLLSNFLPNIPGQYYTSRVRLFGTNTANTYLQLLFNGIPGLTPVDVQGYFRFSMPTIWTYIDIPVKSVAAVGSNNLMYPQIIINANGSIGKIYIDEIQIFKSAPYLITSPRRDNRIYYTGGLWNNVDALNQWAVEFLSGSAANNVHNGKLQIRTSGTTTTEVKFTASSTDNYSGTVTVNAQPEQYIGGGMDIKLSYGAFDILETMVLFSLLGTNESGSTLISGDIAAVAQIGQINTRRLKTAFRANSPYYQVQFRVKNTNTSTIEIDNTLVEISQEDPNYGDAILFPK